MKDDCVNSVTKVDTGRYLGVGTTESFGKGKSDIYLIMIDEER